MKSIGDKVREEKDWKVVRSSSEEGTHETMDHHEKGLSPLEIDEIDAEEGEKKSKKETSKKHQEPMNLFNSFLTFFGISIGAIFGVFVRIGFGYYKIWKTDTNYTLMYCQIVGCFIMGYALKLKFHHFEHSKNRMVKILFTAITTGLCGCTTSFSSWQLQCNRNFFLQWDLSWGNVGGSYNGGRLFEWFVCMWGGIVVPLSALHLGFYVSSTLHPPVPEPPERADEKVKVVLSSFSSSFGSSLKPLLPEILLLVAFCVTIILVTAIPALYYPHWIFLSYSAVFGICGAYLRYLLSDLNAISPTFPWGTFIANVLGTWIASFILTLSKFMVEYYDLDLQAILYGLLTGFCGGLTTVSTLVKELDSLPVTEAYIYSITTHSLSQIGILLILNIYTYLTVPSFSVMPPPINMCHASTELCDTFLKMIDCPVEDQTNIGCGGLFDYDQFQGVCSCGEYKTNRINLLLVDSQIKGNITNSMVMVWPTQPSTCDQPTEVFDFCLTYENICLHFLDRIDCPHSLRRTLACDKQGLSNFVPLCECGELVSATQRIKDAIVDITLSRRYDLFPYLGYPTLTTIDFEAGYLDLCAKMMDHIQCPTSHRCMRGNYIPGNFSTWLGFCVCNYKTSCSSLEQSFLTSHFPHLLPSPPPQSSSSLPLSSLSSSSSSPSSSAAVGGDASGGVTAGGGTASAQERITSPDPHVDFSIRIAKNIFDALLKPNYQLLLVQPNSSTSPQVWDLCGSYYNICTFFLQKIACPVDLQYSTPCGQPYNSTTPSYHSETGEYLYPHGKIQNVTSYCRCGEMNVLDARSFELVITGLLSQIVNEEYTYLPSPVAPYSLAISSDPYKQLIQARHVLPL